MYLSALAECDAGAQAPAAVCTAALHQCRWSVALHAAADAWCPNASPSVDASHSTLVAPVRGKMVVLAYDAVVGLPGSMAGLIDVETLLYSALLMKTDTHNR